jgi:aldehyde dehydrogenase (NAD+)
MHTYDQLYIGGTWVDPTSDRTIDVISPFTEELVGRVPEATEADVDRSVAAAKSAFNAGEWRRATPEARLEVLDRFADLYEGAVDEMAQLITEENGSTISFSRMVQSPAPLQMLATFREIGAAYPWEESRPGVLADSIVRREPVGVVAAIVPWNVPQVLIMAKMAPALIAGCSVVVKPAPETPLDAMMMAELVDRAGFPPGVISFLPAGREVSEYLVRHVDVSKVAFTGSTAAGRRIASICGEQLKRVSLELGGKSAALILPDADIPSTVEGLGSASLMLSGQTCVAQTRLLVPRHRHDEFVEALISAVSGMVVGDPRDDATEIGPLISQRQQERVEKYIALGQEEGAQVLLGGNGRPVGQDRGWFVQPTVFTKVNNRMRIAREEIFGPVLVVIPYEDEEDAIAIANDSNYGLGGSVWTADVDHGLDVARRIETGTIGVNHYTFDFNSPFGGFKDSGVGREYGREGLEAYLEFKSMYPAP